MLQAKHVTVALTLATIFASLGHARGDEPGQNNEVRTYRIADLVLQPKDYGLERPINTSGTNGLFSVAERSYLGQMDDFGADTSAPKKPSRRDGIALRLTVDDVLEIIGSNIQPDSWDSVGGSGHISYAAGLLVVSQSAECHQQIGQLLDNLRKQGATVNSLTIRAYWVATEDISSMLIDHRTLDRKKLVERVAKQGAMAQISCFDGQTVYLVAGNERSTVNGVIPVVGQLETSPNPAGLETSEAIVADLPKHVLAQLGPSGDAAIGYQPVTSTQTEGCMLQVSAVLDPKTNTAVVDVHSDVVHPNAAPDQHDFNGVTKLDKVDNVVQQFKTTLRLPTNQPVLVGGASVRPMQGKGEAQHRQLHLVLEVWPD